MTNEIIKTKPEEDAELASGTDYIRQLSQLAKSLSTLQAAVNPELVRYPQRKHEVGGRNDAYLSDSDDTVY